MTPEEKQGVVSYLLNRAKAASEKARNTAGPGWARDWYEAQATALRLTADEIQNDCHLAHVERPKYGEANLGRQISEGGRP